MSVDYATLNDSVLDAFGEAVTFATGSGPAELSCVIERPAPPIGAVGIASDVLGAPVLGPGDLLLTARTSEVTAAGIDTRDTAEIGGHTYTVTGVWPDSGAMTTLELRA